MFQLLYLSVQTLECYLLSYSKFGTRSKVPNSLTRYLDKCIYYNNFSLLMSLEYFSFVPFDVQVFLSNLLLKIDQSRGIKYFHFEEGLRYFLITLINRFYPSSHQIVYKLSV